MNQKSLVEGIIATRYPRPTNPVIEEYLEVFGASRSSVAFLMDELNARLDEPFEWQGYRLTKGLVRNQQVFQRRARQVVGEFRLKAYYEPDDIRNFFLTNHLIIKYATQRWLLANAGAALEQFVIADDNVEPGFLAALRERGVRLGDPVVHFHVISNSERQELVAAGLEVPHTHWDRSYYVQMLATVAELLDSSVAAVGLFCEDSWVFDPDLHKLASDGRPLVAFDFLSDDHLVGERFLVGIPTSTNAYAIQYGFALRSSRRRALHMKGEFFPKTYGIFYPKQLLKQNLPDILG